MADTLDLLDEQVQNRFRCFVRPVTSGPSSSVVRCGGLPLVL
jgi:hypothetical protein